MSRNGKRPPLFQRLQAALTEGIAFARGDLALRTTEVPTPPPPLSAREIRRLRRRFNVSQGVFARMLNVSLKTVQSWEQGERKPSQAALRLLQLLNSHPEAVCQTVGLV